MAERDPKRNSLFVARAYSTRHSFYFEDNDKKDGITFRSYRRKPLPQK